MQYITKPTVEFVGVTLDDNSLPFANEIDTICLGYRQCYTKDPHKPLVPPKDEQIPKFLYTVDRYLSAHPDMFQRFQKLERNVVDEYLLKCFFISEHLSHESPLEHAKLTVRITNLSRAASHQLVRHRLASFSQQSQRYVGEKDGLVVSLPASIRNNEEAFNTVKDLFTATETAMAKLKELGIKNEDIRCVYPNAQTTAIVMTANFREWMHIFSERCCTRAQTEIRVLMNQILKYFQDNIPLIFDEAGAKCVRLGYCPEPQKFTCGKYITKETLFPQLKLTRIHGNDWLAERNPDLPIPKPVNSLDIEHMTSCEKFHAGLEMLKSVPTNRAIPEESLEYLDEFNLLHDIAADANSRLFELLDYDYRSYDYNLFIDKLTKNYATIFTKMNGRVPEGIYLFVNHFDRCLPLHAIVPPELIPYERSMIGVVFIEFNAQESIRCKPKAECLWWALPNQYYAAGDFSAFYKFNSKHYYEFLALRYIFSSDPVVQKQFIDVVNAIQQRLQ